MSTGGWEQSEWSPCIKVTHLCARDDFLHVILRSGDFLSGAPQPLDASPVKLLERLALVLLIEDDVLSAPAVSDLAFNQLF